jgi:hypothetical protein
MMKKLFLVAVVALLATPLFASDMQMDAKLGYARGNGSANGFNVNPGLYFYSLYSSEDFVKDLSIGADFDFAMLKGTDALGASAWTYNIGIAPMLKMAMPYSYFKLGFGYTFSKTPDDNLNLFGIKFNVAGLYPIADGMNLGLDFGMMYAFNSGRPWVLSVGPVLSFDL